MKNPLNIFWKKKKPTKNTSNTSHLELEVLNASSRSSQNYPACAVQCRIHSTPVKLALMGIVFKNVLLSANIYTSLQQFSLLTPVSLVFSAYYTGSWLDHLCHKRKRTPVTQMFQCKLQHISPNHQQKSAYAEIDLTVECRPHAPICQLWRTGEGPTAVTPTAGWTVKAAKP